MRKKYHLICIFTLFLAILLSKGSVFAHTLDNVVFNSTTELLKVSGMVDIDVERALNDVTLQVLKKGKNFDGNITPLNWHDYYNYIYQLNVDTEGRFDAEFPVESEYGFHNLRVVFPDGTSRYASFVYLSQNEKVNLLNDVNKALSTALMKEVFGKYDYIFSDLTLTRELSDYFPGVDTAEKIAQGMAVAGKTYNSPDEVVAVYNAQAVTVYINLVDTGEDVREIIKDNAEHIGLLNDIVYTGLYYQLDDTKKAEICNILVNKNFSNSSSLVKDFGENIILYFINSAQNWMYINSILEKSGAYIDITKYNTLNANQRQYVDKMIVEEDYNNFSDFVSAFKSAVDKPYDDNRQTDTGGSGKTSSSPNNSYIVAGIDSSNSYITDRNKTESDKVFLDIDDVLWAEEAINYLSKKGIVNGRGNNKFDPESYVTREEFVKMLALAFNLVNNEAKCDFKDVNAEDWSYNYISSLYEIEIIKGISYDLFGPSEFITRQDIAVIAHRSLVYLNKTLDALDYEIFADDADISDYARTGVYALRRIGVINGKGYNFFAAKEFATRAETAKIIYCLLNNGDQL